MKTQSGSGSVELITKVKRSQLVVDEAVQSRCGTDQETAEAYAEAIRNGAKLPPIQCVRTPAGVFIVWDGMHRKAAFDLLKTTEVTVLARNGTLDDAILLAAGANADHGRPRSRNDKERCVLMLLARDQWKSKSVKWLADASRVSQHFAERVKTEYFGKQSQVVGRDGREQSATKRKHVEKSTNQVPAREPDSEKPRHVAADSYSSEPETLERLGNATPAEKLVATQVEDQYDRPVPARLVRVFEHRRTLDRLARTLSGLKSEIIAALRHESRAGKRISLPAVEKALGDAWDTMRGGMAHCVCPECAGEPASDGNDECPTCSGDGWLHDTAAKNLPSRLKKIAQQHCRQGA